MNRFSIRPLALTMVVLSLVSPWAAATVATLERVAGQPVIYEIGAAGARHVSLVDAGARYTLPIEIETGPADSAEFRLPDSAIQVAPGSIMRIAAPEARESGLFQRILQKAGSSLFAVDRRTVEHFEVETPYLVSVVKGTTFNVVVHDAGATVALHEGRLLVSTPDGSRQVELLPGDVAYSDAAGALEKLSHNQARATAPPTEAGDEGTSTGVDVAQVPAAIATADPTVEVTHSLAATHADVALDAVMDGGLVSAVDDAAGDLLAGVGDVGGAGGDLVGDLGGNLTGDAGDLVGDLGGAGGDLVGDLGGSAGDLVGGVGGTLGDLVGDVGGSAGDLVCDVGGTVGDLVGDLGEDLVGDLGGTAGDLVGDLGGSTGDLVQDVGGTGGDLVEDVGGAVGGLLGGGGGGLLGGGLGL
ncbi:MAG: FecR domain-containing protein [Pseudomonadales bacterium]